MTARTTRRKLPGAARRKGENRETAGSLARFVLIAALLAFAFRSFVGAPFSIPSGSMLPTLYVGDYVAVAKWPYGYSRFSFPFGFPPFDGRLFSHMPRRGDVVVFRHPAEPSDLIKRVIGLPGDVVAVHEGRLYLNGQMVRRQALPPAQIALSPNSPCRVIPPATPFVAEVRKQHYCLYKAYLETLPSGPSYTVLDQVDHGAADEFSETRVPPGHLFLMGDNRDDSLDSRFSEFEGGVGMVPTKNLIGRASFTFWSTDGSASWFKPWTWFSALRFDRIGNGYTGQAR